LVVHARPWQWLESAIILLLTAALGAAWGSAAFFADLRVAPRRPLSLAAGLLSLVVAVVWLRFEVVQGGWTRAWEEHPGRLLRAAALLAPAPVLFGISCPEWWEGYIAQPMGLPVRAWQAGLLYAGCLAAVACFYSELGSTGLLTLWADPERLELSPTD